jgi:hypothetical protein
MQLTPAIKGQITKRLKVIQTSAFHQDSIKQDSFIAVRDAFRKLGLPAQQAKHACRKYLAGRRFEIATAIGRGIIADGL